MPCCLFLDTTTERFISTNESCYPKVTAVASVHMVATIAINKICLEPGSRITIPDVSWHEFESILQELGESRNSRIAYRQNTLELMVPLPNVESLEVVFIY